MGRLCLRILILCGCSLLPCLGESFIKAQRASIARQQASVRRQHAAARRAVSYLVSDPAPVPTISPACRPLERSALEHMISAAALANAVPEDIVREVARQESAFLPCAISSKGAEGLMQLMPATQAGLGVADPFDPGESLMAGARLLKELLGRYGGNLALALSAYNAGPARVDAAGGIPPISETRNYVREILSRLTE